MFIHCRLGISFIFTTEYNCKQLKVKSHVPNYIMKNTYKLDPNQSFDGKLLINGFNNAPIDRNLSIKFISTEKKFELKLSYSCS